MQEQIPPARHVVVVSERGPNREYARGEGNERGLWYAASGYPNPAVFRSGPTITSAELVAELRAAIEA